MRSSGGLFVALAVALFGMTGTAAHANVLITVNKSTQHMTVTVDGEKRYSWPVSTGRSGYATPSGAYTPFRMEEDHFSKEWDDAPMPHSIFFTPKGHAIHGSYETKHLGSAVSHGCVRLSPQNAATLYALVKDEGMNNTKVVLTGEAPPLVARRASPHEARGAAEPMDLQRYRSPYGRETNGMQSQYEQSHGQPRYQQGYGVQYQQPYATQPRYAPYSQPYAQRYYGSDPRFDPGY